MVGSGLLRGLARRGFCDVISPSSKELDLRDQTSVRNWFERERPEYVFVVAAKAGGVQANLASPLDFLYDNAMIALNVLGASQEFGVLRTMFIASTAVYPRDAEQPVRESSLFTGPFEPSNEAYGIAKALGVKYCQYAASEKPGRFLAVTPSNIYGPGDKYDSAMAHVVPSMIRRFHEAKMMNAPQVDIWGSGRQVREFLYVDDVVDACLMLMDEFKGGGPVNIGADAPTTIAELADAVADVVGYNGEIVFDVMKPEGAPSRISDGTLLRSYSWVQRVSLEEGLRRTYDDYLTRFA